MEKHIDQFGCIPELDNIMTVNLVGDPESLTKSAASYSYVYSPEMLDAIERYRKEKTEEEILATVIALGAGEYYSSNVNGDFFFENDLITIYPSFENGHLFQHHMNRDKNTSLGRNPDAKQIKFATYNQKMRRVELLIAPSRFRAPMWVAQIESGMPVDVSFGFKTPFDTCSICGKTSKNRSEYCDHLMHQMNMILPDGRKVYAINPSVGKFFELSFVRKGAVPIARIMEKVASSKQAVFVGHSATPGIAIEEIDKVSAPRQQKKYAGLKLGQMVKEIENNLQHSGVDENTLKRVSVLMQPYTETAEKPLDPRLFAGHSYGDVVGTLPVMGIVPTLREFASILMSLKMDIEELKSTVANLRSDKHTFPGIDGGFPFGNGVRVMFSRGLANRLDSDGNNYMFHRSWHAPHVISRGIVRVVSGDDNNPWSAIRSASTNVQKDNMPLVRWLYDNFINRIFPSVYGYKDMDPKLAFEMAFPRSKPSHVVPDIEFYSGPTKISPISFEKHAKLLWTVGAPFLAGQLISANLYNKQMGGEGVSPIGAAVAKHPFMASGGMVAGALTLSSLLKGLKEAAKIKFTKRASFSKEVLYITKNELVGSIVGDLLNTEGWSKTAQVDLAGVAKIQINIDA